jgi:hypothetical protein
MEGAGGNFKRPGNGAAEPAGVLRRPHRSAQASDLYTRMAWSGDKPRVLVGAGRAAGGWSQTRGSLGLPAGPSPTGAGSACTHVMPGPLIRNPGRRGGGRQRVKQQAQGSPVRGWCKHGRRGPEPCLANRLVVGIKSSRSCARMQCG